jgi:hypothetical protein
MITMSAFVLVFHYYYGYFKEAEGEKAPSSLNSVNRGEYQ